MLLLRLTCELDESMISDAMGDEKASVRAKEKHLSN